MHWSTSIEFSISSVGTQWAMVSIGANSFSHLRSLRTTKSKPCIQSIHFICFDTVPRRWTLAILGRRSLARIYCAISIIWTCHRACRTSCTTEEISVKKVAHGLSLQFHDDSHHHFTITQFHHQPHSISPSTTHNFTICYTQFHHLSHTISLFSSHFHQQVLIHIFTLINKRNQFWVISKIVHVVKNEI